MQAGEYLAVLAAALALCSCALTSTYKRASWKINDATPDAPYTSYYWYREDVPASCTQIACRQRGSGPALEACVRELRRSGKKPPLHQARLDLIACMHSHGWERGFIQVNT